MIYFTTRQAARNFAGQRGRRVTDNGTQAVAGRRWGVRVVNA